MTKPLNLRRIFSLLVIFLGVSAMAGAQAVLPTSWGFDTATPTGWTESLGTSNTRYANGFAGQACRLDATGDYVVVEFAEEPGLLSFYIKGQNAGGAWSGTFTIEESADGSSYTSLNQFVDAALPTSAFTAFNNQPLATTRFIRFYFTNKVSGYNVALDDVSIAAPTAGTAQEINVQQAGINIPSGFTFSTGNASSTAFTIQNFGSGQALAISDIVLSGADAAQFSLSGIPSSIDALSSADFSLDFAPIGTGSRFCTITISNDDASEGEYVINVYAISGTLASEPTAQAGAVSFSGVVSYDHNVSFSAGSPVADYYLVLRKKGSAITDIPLDGASYVQGDQIGASQVVYIGDAGQFNARYVVANTDYYYAIFAGNGPSGYQNYLTDSPSNAMVSSPAANPGTYFNGLNHNAASFVGDLTAKMEPANYFQVYYSNYISTLIDEFYVRDTSIAGVSNSAVDCMYSNDNYNYEAGFQWWNGQNDGRLSREHSFPQSWMPTYLDANFDASYEVSDLHNLFPVLQVECNAVRSNYPYGEVTTVNSSYLECKFGTNSLGQTVYEPRNAFKGNVARAVMYHSVKNNTTADDFSFPEQISLTIQYGQSEYLLKSWHFNDLPDNLELARNEYIQSKQNNRNAFIDSVLYPCFIRFSNLTKWAPIVTYSNEVLTAIDPGVSYQWSFNGTPIVGATSATYTPTEDGNYSVEVQQFNECPTFTSSTTVVNTAVNELKNGFSSAIYPNPNKGDFSLTMNIPQGGNAQMNILDLTGKLVHTQRLNLASGDNRFVINTNLTPGVYVVEITNDTAHSTTRLVVE